MSIFVYAGLVEEGRETYRLVHSTAANPFPAQSQEFFFADKYWP